MAALALAMLTPTLDAILWYSLSLCYRGRMLLFEKQYNVSFFGTKPGYWFLIILPFLSSQGFRPKSPHTQRNLDRHARLGGRRMQEAFPPPLFPSPDGEQSDSANDIQDQYYNRVDAKVKELAFGAED